MLSLILYGRNDSYGYNLHKRAAISLNCMAEMLTAPGDEILFVDYNTPDDFPTFPEAIADTLTDKAKGLLRILRVRPRQHEPFRQLTRLVALEPIARNVAIRRSSPDNRWILSTNTDMVFVPRRGESLSEIASDLPDNYYHLPRFEVPETLWESADRLDPAGTIAAFGAWGRDFHLNEIVYSQDPTVRYDAPGDFQLILRSDLWRVRGFHESMLLGWHVDSNMAKRLALLPYKIGDVAADVFGYHCDHTRQVTPMHRPRAGENDLQVFFEEVTASDVPAQAETWGLAGEEVEEIRIGTTSRAYLEALRSVVSVPLAEPSEIRYSGDSYNRVDYSVDHVIPFVLDIFAGYPRDTVVGWCGAKESLLRRFAQAWTAMGFSEKIVVFSDAQGPRVDLPDGCVPGSGRTIEDRCNVFVFDWGRPDDDRAAEWTFEADDAIRGITRAFRRMVRSERLRLRHGAGPPRRFVGINVVNNDMERLFGEHVGAARAPIATRIRQGFVSESRESQDLLPLLHVGLAGKRVSGAIVAQPGVAGFLFYGPYLSLDGRAYHLTLDFDPASRALDPGADAGLVLEVVCGYQLAAYREITAADLAGGSVSFEFGIPLAVDEAEDWPLTEFRLLTTGQADITIRSAVLDEASPSAEPASALADLDYLPLLALGPAGDRAEAPAGPGGRVIRAKLGPADFVCYGPYLWLARGHHKATFEFSIERAERGAEIRVEAVTDFGSRILAEGYVEAGRPGRAQCVLGFDIDSGAPSHDTGLLELRVWSPGTIQFGLLSLRVERAPRSERESAQARELLPLLHPGNAGDKKSDDGIAAVPGAAGFVFYGPPLDVDAGGHRLTLGLVRDATAMRPVHGSGLGVEVVSGSRLVGYRPITADELTRGRVSIDFTIPADGPDEKKSRAEFRLLTTGQTDVTVSRVALGRTPLGSRPDLSEFDYLPLLKVGPAGDSDRAGSRKRRLAFRAKRGVAGFVAFGPYVWLPKGRYEVTFELYAVRAERGAAMKVEVAADVGTRILAERSIETHWRGRRFESVLGRRRGTIEAVLAFEMTSDVAPEDGGLLEFRVWSPGTIEFSLVGVRVRKVADLVQVAEEAAVSSP